MPRAAPWERWRGPMTSSRGVGGASASAGTRPLDREPDPSYDLEPDFASAPPPRAGVFDFEAPERFRRAA